MTHIEQRLAERNIHIEYDKLCVIAKHCSTSAAILLGHVPAQNDTGAYRSREESNGDLVVLIVRNGEPKTIMFRRSNQPFTAEAMHVRAVYTL